MEQGQIPLPQPMNRARWLALYQILKDTEAEVTELIEQFDRGKNPLQAPEHYEIGLLVSQETILAKIQQMLSRLLVGDCGYCERCGGEIDLNTFKGLIFKRTCKWCDQREAIARRVQQRFLTLTPPTLSSRKRK